MFGMLLVPELDHAQPRSRRDPRRHRLRARGAHAAARTARPARRPRRTRCASRSSGGARSRRRTRRAVLGSDRPRVLRRPGLSLALVDRLLLALASPVVGLRLGASGVTTLPDRFDSKQGFVALQRTSRGRRPTRSRSSWRRRTSTSRRRAGAAIARLEPTRARSAFGRRRSSARPDGEVAALVASRSAATRPATTRVEAVRDLRATIIPLAFADTGARCSSAARPPSTSTTSTRDRPGRRRVRLRARPDASSC